MLPCFTLARLKRVIKVYVCIYQNASKLIILVIKVNTVKHVNLLITDVSHEKPLILTVRLKHVWLFL